MKIALINGANLNMLGIREKSVYGNITLEDIEKKLKQKAEENGVELVTFQSNSEGELINFIHSLYNKCDGIIFNPGAFTHYSIALRDALLAVNIPFVEIHISNIYKREEFRHKSFFSDIAIGVISGLGTGGYILAFEGLIEFLKSKEMS